MMVTDREMEIYERGVVDGIKSTHSEIKKTWEENGYPTESYPLYCISLLTGIVVEFYSIDAGMALIGNTDFPTNTYKSNLTNHTNTKVWKVITKEELQVRLEDAKLIYNDWRLPTLEELSTLIDRKICNPASKILDTASAHYWTSTGVFTRDPSNDKMWVIGFKNGTTDTSAKELYRFVYCVRDGKNGLEWTKSSTNSMTYEKAVEYAEELEATTYYVENMKVLLKYL